MDRDSKLIKDGKKEIDLKYLIILRPYQEQINYLGKLMH